MVIYLNTSGVGILEINGPTLRMLSGFVDKFTQTYFSSTVTEPCRNFLSNPGTNQYQAIRLSFLLEEITPESLKNIKTYK